MLLAMETSTILFWLGLLAIVFGLMRRSQKRIKLSKYPPITAPPTGPAAPAAHHLDAPAAAGRWEVDMHELARDLMGQLDSKIVIVEQLVREAQQATARLEAATARAEQLLAQQRLAISQASDAAPPAETPGAAR